MRLNIVFHKFIRSRFVFDLAITNTWPIKSWLKEISFLGASLIFDFTALLCSKVFFQVSRIPKGNSRGKPGLKRDLGERRSLFPG